MTLRYHILALGLALAAAALPARAKPVLLVFDYPSAGSQPSQGTKVFAINDAGDVTGSYVDQSNVTRGFIRFADGTLRFIDVNGLLSRAINRNDLVSGSYNDGFGVHAFVTGPSDADPFVHFDVAGSSDTEAVDIDNIGAVTGNYAGPNGEFHGFVRSAAGKIRTFDAPGAGTASQQGTFAAALGYGRFRLRLRRRRRQCPSRLRGHAERRVRDVRSRGLGAHLCDRGQYGRHRGRDVARRGTRWSMASCAGPTARPSRSTRPWQAPARCRAPPCGPSTSARPRQAP